MMKSAKTLRHQVGLLFIVGLEGTGPSSLETAWLRTLQPSGIILFKRNIESPRQVHDLFHSVSAALRHPFFRCVDLEGGTVDRLRDLIGPTPSAATVAVTGRLAFYKKHGALIGRMLETLGFQVNFAPVLDLATPACRAVMGTRVVAEDPAAVAQYARAFLAGLASHGVYGCGKHFPGLGSGNLDSHQAMPKIVRTWKQMQLDISPYHALHASLPFIMVNHSAYPEIEQPPKPASLSRFWITDILRKQIKYRGLILSDDMEMGGVLNYTSIEDAAIEAIAAGTDLIEICHRPDRILGAYEAVLHEAECSPTFARTVAAASARVLRSRSRLLHRSQLPRPASTAQIENLRTALRKFTDALAEHIK
ncbi:MAG TPA: beta-N-acetylhexosaminidase [Acidobacteriaceae bacterium]|jgi:beta-N-acetylhexosaminidase|nr:beta-N-acetylhexosaminidase [Acidobacteriaceae bacterium]